MPWVSRNASFFPWDEETEKVLRVLWPEGKSATFIAKLLTELKKTPITRNAVLGKLSRMGLLRKPTKAQVIARGQEISRKISAVRRKLVPPERILKPTPVPVVPMDQRTFPWRVKLMARLASQCPYPLPNSPADADMLVCGDRIGENGVYCDACRAVCVSTRAVLPPEKFVTQKFLMAVSR